MKKIFLLFIILFPLASNAQALIGYSLSEIKAMYPNNTFKTDYSTQIKNVSTENEYGTLFYYFDSTSGLSNICVLIPLGESNLNAVVKLYNEKYVAISKMKWRAYLKGGVIMYITLTYDEESKWYAFFYSNKEF